MYKIERHSAFNSYSINPHLFPLLTKAQIAKIPPFSPYSTNKLFEWKTRKSRNQHSVLTPTKNLWTCLSAMQSNSKARHSILTPLIYLLNLGQVLVRIDVNTIQFLLHQSTYWALEEMLLEVRFTFNSYSLNLLIEPRNASLFWHQKISRLRYAVSKIRDLQQNRLFFRLFVLAPC